MASIVTMIHEQDGVYGASFPDLPGCTTVSRSPDTVIAKAVEAAAFHLQGLQEDGATPARFRTLAELRRDPAFAADAQGAMIALLGVELPTRSVRVNITLDETTLRRIDDAARAAGESRSGFLAEAARKRLAAAG